MSFALDKVLYLFVLLPFICAQIQIYDVNIVNKWHKSADAFDQLLWPQSQTVLNLIDKLTTTQTVAISQSCSKGLQEVAKGIKARKVWALKFLEASASGKSGFLKGYFSDLGDYLGCISISHQPPANSPEIKGQYCLLQLHFPIPEKPNVNKYEKVELSLKDTPLEDTYYASYAKEIKFFYNNTFTFGFCIPTGCTKQDMSNVAQKILQGTSLTQSIRSCEKVEPKDFPRLPRYQQTAITLLLILALFVACSTLITYLFGDYVSPYIAAFSAVKNTQMLVKESKDGSTENLQYMHCIRFSLRSFGLLGHIFLTLGILPHTFPLFSYQLPMNWFARETFKHMFVFIEVFFLMSGFLVAYSWYPEIKSRGRISFLQYTLVRYFRSTPLFLGILLLVFVFAGIGSGPIFTEFRDLIAGNCMNNWWTNIFYVSNWVRPYKMCYMNWWSVSVDFQLYCLSYLPMMWLVTKPRRGVITLLALIFLGPLITAIVTMIKRIPVVVCCSLDYDYEDMFAEHFRTYTHSAPYYMGMLVGYLVASKKRIRNRIFLTASYCIAIACWIATFVLAYYYVDKDPDTWQEIVYISFQKPLFSIFYAWIFYAFSFKMGGIVQKNMGFKIFVPFSRLTYSISMSEMLFIWYDITNSHQYFPSDTYNMIMRVTYIFSMCTLLGYLVFLLFEAPSTNLMKLLLKRSIKKEAVSHAKKFGSQKVE